MFHNENHLENTCPRWKQLASKIVAQFVDLVMVEKHDYLEEEKEKVVAADEAPSTGHAVNIYQCVIVTQKSSTNKEPLSDGLAQK